MELELPSDIDQLSILSDNTILELLAQRYADDDIYTWAGSTLVAINPYKNIDSYYFHPTQQQLCDVSTSDEPHIYSIAKNAVTMIDQKYAGKANASIIVSGESGSGKTESTKHLLRWLTVEKSHSTARKQRAEQVEQQILAFGPVLESFGNACTSRNGNSSRFGKYIMLQFDKDQSIVGAHIQTYLLEKTRVVHQGEHNFNFHIFYQFLRGISAEEKKRYLVAETDTYNYAPLIPKTGYKLPSWQSLLHTLSNAGFTISDQEQICVVLGAILCLGNITFVSSADDEVLILESSYKYVEKASCLLGLTSHTLKQILLFRCISASHSRRKSVFHKPCVLSEAVARRDCLAKLLYDRLFSFLVKHINCRIESQIHSSFIGLLDIYGFESFSENSLEQLCINYANERLQHYFVQYYLKDIQAEYAEQGISCQTVHPTSDNTSCVQLMSDSPGVFSVLDEECQLNRLKSQEVTERLMHLNPHPNLICSRKNVLNKRFSIQHYAACVSYSSSSLVEKNMDLIPSDIVTALAESEVEFVSVLAEDCVPTAKGKQLKKTVLSKFKGSLDGLLEKLRSTECQYVRCIKPNEMAVSATFDKIYVNKQLRACGIMETVKIRSQVHAIRLSYTRFISTYSILHSTPDLKALSEKDEADIIPLTVRQRRRTLLPAAQLNSSPGNILSSPHAPEKRVTRDRTNRKKCREIIQDVISADMQGLVSYGATKIFIKNIEVMELLETAREKRLNRSAFSIQCAWKRYKVLKRWQECNGAAGIIIKAMKKFVKIKRAANLAKLKVLDLKVMDKPVLETKESDRQTDRPSSITNTIAECQWNEWNEWNESHANHGKGGITLVKNRIIFIRSGILSIRYLHQVKVQFHVRTAALLKNSHIAPRKLILQCSLLDCVEL